MEKQITKFVAPDTTPGPFHWHDTFGRKYGEGNPIPKNALGEGPPLGQCSPFSFAVTDDRGFCVAHCTNALVTMSSERSTANARALAAYHDLTTALIDCIKVYEEHRNEQPTGHLWPDPNHIFQAKDALRKAGFVLITDEGNQTINDTPAE